MTAGGSHTSITHWPTLEDHPRGKVNDNHSVLYLTSQFSFQSVHVQFGTTPEALALTVQYLRELAAAATDLADQVQHKLEDATVAAVLES